jgi:hypothetical protein
MTVFRQFIAPLLIVLVFVVALVAVGARIFLPSDMAAPAPIEDVDQKAEVPSGSQLSQSNPASVAELPPYLAPNLTPSLEILVKGLPLDTDES